MAKKYGILGTINQYEAVTLKPDGTLIDDAFVTANTPLYRKGNDSKYYKRVNVALTPADKGVANGVASLDATGKVPESQLPPMQALTVAQSTGQSPTAVMSQKAVTDALLVAASLSPASYGAVGDGVADDTAALNTLFADAKAKKKSVFLEGGSVYKFTPTATTDLTGVPGIRGAGTIDASSVASGFNLFKITGTKMQLATGIPATAGAYTITLPAGLFIRPGQTLFIASGEAYPNAYRSHYFKGQRVTVESYNSATGALLMYEPIQFSITSATVWLNDYQPYFKLDASIKLIGNPAQLMGGVIGQYATLDIEGELVNFTFTAVGAYSSLLHARYKAYNSYKTDSGNSYGCAIADFSQAYLRQCDIKGAIHAVSLGGGAEYQSIFGGNGSLAAAYPCNAQIDGGTYISTQEGLKPAIDGHGNVNSLIISNAVLYGGLTYSGAKLATFNCEINYNKTNGFEPNIESVNEAFGDFEFHNTTFNAVNIPLGGVTGFRLNNPVRSITFNNVTINEKPASSGVNAILIDVPPTYLTIDGLTINTLPTETEPIIKFKNNNTLFKDITVNGAGMRFDATVTGLNFVCDNFTGSNGVTGLQLNCYSKRLKDVVIRNATARGYKRMGIWVGGADKVTIQNSFSNDNGTDTAASAGLRAAVFLDYCGTVLLQNNDLSSSNNLQQYAVFHKVETAVEYGWSGNNIKGNVLSVPYQFFGTMLYQFNILGNTALPNVMPSPYTASQFRLSALNNAPATATDAGVAGEIRVVADFIYVCVAANTWVRSPLATW